MKFSIAVYASPASSELALTALQFAEGVVKQGHEIYRLFFFNEGVLNGVALPGDKPTENSSTSLCERWQRLIHDHGLDAVVCVTSAKKRGIVERDGPGATSNTPGLPVADGFTISGLGQLIDAAVNSDRMITFGN